MISFEVLKQSKKSRARLGVLHTPHGDIETPSFVPVATQATIKTLLPEQVKQTGSQLVISNTFHLHLKPGADIVALGGGLHDFMHWDRPIMTDSGGFQVFSLGFGADLGYGKIVRPETADTTREHIDTGHQPKKVRIGEDGVSFKSPLTGEWLFLGPRESIEIQQKLGADIMYAFDECTPPFATHEYVRQSLERTHRWITESLEARKTDQALYGIVQGSRFEDLRKESAEFNAKAGFDGYGIGGDLGLSKEESLQILGWVIPLLDQTKPRHLLGIGRPEDLSPIISGGVDTFDCIVPTQYARHGAAFVGDTRYNIRQAAAKTDQRVLEEGCECYACISGFSRSYIAHLFRSGEISALSLLTMHNLTYMNRMVMRLRQKIANDEI